ncbi:hypothetical protein JW859_10030 [bacterium]|nr:hypothetical protein [bacterium]
MNRVQLWIEREKDNFNSVLLNAYSIDHTGLVSDFHDQSEAYLARMLPRRFFEQSFYVRVNEDFRSIDCAESTPCLPLIIENENITDVGYAAHCKYNIPNRIIVIEDFHYSKLPNDMTTAVTKCKLDKIDRNVYEITGICDISTYNYILVPTNLYSLYDNDYKTPAFEDSIQAFYIVDMNQYEIYNPASTCTNN